MIIMVLKNVQFVSKKHNTMSVQILPKSRLFNFKSGGGQQLLVVTCSDKEKYVDKASNTSNHLSDVLTINVL